MNLDLTPTQVLAGIGVALCVVLVWRFSARKARRAAEAARQGARLVSLVGRVVLMAAAMVLVQWLVTHRTTDVTLHLVVLTLPDLIAAHVLTRTLTVTELGTTSRRGDRQ